MNKMVGDTESRELEKYVVNALRKLEKCSAARIEVRKEINGKIFLEINTTERF